jgi:hypothetical protein
MADVVEAGNFFAAALANENGDFAHRIDDASSQRSSINDLANKNVTNLHDLNLVR